MTPDSPDTSPENLRRLTELHVGRYAGRLRHALSGVPGFRMDELVRYLRLWLEVIEAEFVWDRLSGQAKAEVSDALEDEGGSWNE